MRGSVVETEILRLIDEINATYTSDCTYWDSGQTFSDDAVCGAASVRLQSFSHLATPFLTEAIVSGRLHALGRPWAVKTLRELYRSS